MEIKQFDLGTYKQIWIDKDNELVIYNQYPVQDGECISYELEEIKRFPSIGLLLAHLNLDKIKPYEI